MSGGDLSDLLPAVEAYEARLALEAEDEKMQSRRIDQHAKTLMENLGLKPQSIYGGGRCRFNTIILDVQNPSIDPYMIRRVDYCDTTSDRLNCGKEIYTEWVFASLQNIGELIKKPEWRPHVCIADGKEKS